MRSKARIGGTAFFVGSMIAFCLGVLGKSLVDFWMTNAPLEIQRLASLSADPAVETARYTGQIAWWTGFNAMASLFTGAAAYFAYQAFREGRRSADAAVESNEISRRAIEQQLRAYVSVESSRVEYDYGSGTIHASWQLVNRGSTPAYKLVDHRVGEIGEETPKDARLFSSGGPGSLMTIFPNQSISGWVKISNVDEAQWNRILDGEEFLTIGIWGSYFDIFGKKRRYALRAGLVPDSSDAANGLSLTIVRGSSLWT